MSSTTFALDQRSTHGFFSGAPFFSVSIEDAFCTVTQKIKDAASSCFGQGIIGFVLGTGAHKIYMPLTDKIIKFLGVSTILSDPFNGLALNYKILASPLVCVVAPVLEEQMFRGDLQGMLKDKFKSFYLDKGYSDSVANTAAGVSSVFFASIAFGLMHFTNAIVFWCHPVAFVLQVVAATLMGIVFGLAKEFSGQLHMPLGMHIGNNTVAWANYIKGSL